MYYPADDGSVYRSRFDRSPRRSVRRIYDLKTIDLSNTPIGNRRSSSWSRLPSSRLGSGYSGNNYGSGHTSRYNGYSGYGDTGGASSYNFGNHVHPSASRGSGPESLRRSWSRPFVSSFMAEAEADLNAMSTARSRLYKMADDALSVLTAIREGFGLPRRWTDDLLETNIDEDLPNRSYRSPIVMDDSVRRNRSTLIDDADSHLFASNVSVNSLRRSPMPSTSEVLARLETPIDFPPFRYGTRLGSDDWSFCRTEPTRSYNKSDKPKDLDSLRNARMQYFESQQQQSDSDSSGTERNVPIVVDGQKPSDQNPSPARVDAPAPVPEPKVSAKEPVVLEGESPVAPASTPTTTHVKDDAKQCGRNDSYTAPSSMVYSHINLADDTTQRCSKLEEENSRLRDLVHNVTEINKRWQKFNSEREVYINELKATIEQQQEQLNQCLELLRLAQADQMRSEDGQERQNGMINSPAYAHLQSRLREIIEPNATEAELSKLQEEVSRLQRRLEETKKEHSELIGALSQAKTQTNDCEVSKETTTLNEEGFRFDRPISRESTKTPVNVTETTTNDTSKIFTTIDNTAHHEDIHRSTFTRSPSLTQDIDSPTEAQSEPRFCDRHNVPEREKNLFKYAFDGAGLRNCQEDIYSRRHSSPADGLSPTQTPTRGNSRFVPLEVSGSSSSVASIAPVVSIPPSSRESSADRDFSICSDATIDCSPPTPVPVTVGYDRDGLATVTTFRTVPIIRESTPERESDAGSDGGNRSTIEVKPVEDPVSVRPTSYVEEETSCAVASPRGILARTTSTHGSSMDSDGNGRSWASDIFSRGLCADTVSCPKCGNTYPPSKYMQLMIHLDNCRTATSSPNATLQELARNAMNHIMNS